MQGEAYAIDLLISGSFVTVELARLALRMVGAAQWLHTANAYMLPCGTIAWKNWRTLFQTGPAQQVCATMTRSWITHVQASASVTAQQRSRSPAQLYMHSTEIEVLAVAVTEADHFPCSSSKKLQQKRKRA